MVISALLPLDFEFNIASIIVMIIKLTEPLYPKGLNPTEPATIYSNNLLDEPNQLYGISFLFQNGKFLKVPDWI